MYVKALKYSLPLTNPIKNSISSGPLHIKAGAVLQKKGGGRGWGTEWWEKNRSIFNFLHGRNVGALISSTWTSKQRRRRAGPSSYSSPSPATSFAFLRSSRSRLPPLFPSTPRSPRCTDKSICPAPGSSVSAAASASHSPALAVISRPSSFHFPHLPTSRAPSRRHFFSFFSPPPLKVQRSKLVQQDRKKGRGEIQLAKSLYAQQAPFRTGVPTAREIGNPAFWAPSSMQNLPSSSARVDIFPSTHAAHLLLLYKRTDRVPWEKKMHLAERKQSVAPTLVMIQYVRPSTFQENGRNSSVFQKHFKFMFHLALPRRLSQC